MVLTFYSVDEILLWYDTIQIHCKPDFVLLSCDTINYTENGFSDFGVSLL